MKNVFPAIVSAFLLATASCKKNDVISGKNGLTDSEMYQSGTFNEIPYRILIPRQYDVAKQYPLLLFLHGVGERGSDNTLQLVHGATLFQRDSIRTNYPAIVVFPQCPTAHVWDDAWSVQRLSGLLGDLQTRYAVDKKRIYLAGLSMGAYGVYALIPQNPALFAAAVPISGAGDTTKAPLMTKPNYWIFASGNDEVVPSSNSKDWVRALTQAKASVKFTLYPNASHVDSWNRAFAEPDFCRWLFSNAK